jgi:NADH:ubiquinone reductase (H+-translocating)
MSTQPHVVILGAGFGGVGALKKLRDANIRITMINKHDYQAFQPLLYQVATAELTQDQVAIPVRQMLHHHDNVTFHQTMVEAIDLDKKQVSAKGIAPLSYDYLVIALGAVVNFFNTPGAEQHALPLYTMEDAIRLKYHVLKRFEATEKNHALIDDGALTFCIVGGGPTGVELAGALAELVRTNLKADFPHTPLDRVRLILFEHSSHVLGSFKPKLRHYARKQLEARGVEVLAGTGVASVSPKGIVLTSGETIPTHTLVWAGGMEANPITKSLGLATDNRGRIPVGPDLQVEGYPGVFAIGDIAAMTDGKTGNLLPGLGAVALQAGRHVGETIKHLADGRKHQPFEYLDKGTMAQVGRGAAVVELPWGGTLTGHVAWLTWLGVHLALLNGAEERASTFVDWGWNLLTGSRDKRIMLSDEELEAARQREQASENSGSENREKTSDAHQ